MAKRFAVIYPKFTPAGLRVGLPVTRDRHAYSQLVTSTDTMDPARIYQLLQSNVEHATGPARTNPLIHGELHKQITVTNGKNLVLKHGLGEPWATYSCVRVYSGNPFNVIDTVPTFNGGMDPTHYFVVAAQASGVYDIVINPG